MIPCVQQSQPYEWSWVGSTFYVLDTSPKLFHEFKFLRRLEILNRL